jgi:hypothetical protein
MVDPEGVFQGEAQRPEERVSKQYQSGRWRQNKGNLSWWFGFRFAYSHVLMQYMPSSILLPEYWEPHSLPPSLTPSLPPSLPPSHNTHTDPGRAVNSTPALYPVGRISRQAALPFPPRLSIHPSLRAALLPRPLPRVSPPLPPHHSICTLMSSSRAMSTFSLVTPCFLTM